MNPEDFSRDDLLREVSALYLGAGLLVLAVLWLGTWGLRKKWTGGRKPLIGIGFVLVAATFWIVFQLLGKWFALATSWSLIFLALLAALGWEAILWVYEFEKSLVTKKRGRWLLALRLMALTTIIMILLQPVRSFLEEREINREVAVLLDDSESMHLSDQRLSPTETLDRAQLFGNETVVKNRPPLRAIRLQMSDLKAAISTELDAIAAAPSAAAGLESRAENLPAVFKELDAKTVALGELIGQAINQVPAPDDKAQLNE